MSANVPNVELIYHDDTLAVVNKPAGMMAHRSKLSSGEEVFLHDVLVQQLGKSIYLIHRLDRATSGCCLIAFDADTASLLGKQVMANEWHKVYWPVARGWPKESEFTVDYALDGGPGKRDKKPAITHFKLLGRAELPVPFQDFATSRYSWLEATLDTGRFRQIRRHLKHIFHHLIGDTSHGDGRHNRNFRMLGIHRMLLHARALSFTHPHTGETINAVADVDTEFDKALALFGDAHAIE